MKAMTNMNEPVLDCSVLPDYPGLLLYPDGRVFRIKTGRFLRGYDNTHGYRQLDLRWQGQGTPKIHRLIARAFVPNPLNLPFVNHKNGDRQDNRACNLEWCTNLYNTQGLNRARGFGSIDLRKMGRKRYRAQYKKNGAKGVHKCFATREEAQDFLDTEAEIARSELRVDM